MNTVAHTYTHVIGVDTHARHHAYSIITATGQPVDAQQFPTTRAGIDRAVAWISRRTAGDIDQVLIAVECTGTYGAVLARELLAHGYRVVEAPTPRRPIGKGKTDPADASTAAVNSLPMRMDQLRDVRQGDLHDALQVLSTARENMNRERTAAINVLTALVRKHQLGIDARKHLTHHQITTISRWRTHQDDTLAQQIAREEAIRLASRIIDLGKLLAENLSYLHKLVQERVPQLLAIPGIGPVSAAAILAVWSHPGRVRTEAAMAALAGVAPIPASSGNTVRHRLNRHGDRRLNRALYSAVLTNMQWDPRTKEYVQRRTAEGKNKREIIRCLKRFLLRRAYRTLNAIPATA